MTDDSKALPEFEWRGRRVVLHWAGADGLGGGNIDEAALVAQLAAMDADRLAAVLDDAQVPELLVAELRQTQAELAAERAKVAELQRNAAALCDFLGFRVPSSKTPHEWLDQQVRSLKRSADWETQEHARHHQVEDELRATLAKVEAERDGMRAFFAEHGGTLLEAFSGCPKPGPGAAAWDGLEKILATLPKGTKEP